MHKEIDGELECSITAFVGSNDISVNQQDMLPWAKHISTIFDDSSIQPQFKMKIFKVIISKIIHS
jgi:surfactin synthase thioesterase subunit